MSVPNTTTTPAVNPTDALSALLLPLGPWGALAALALKFGSPFVLQLLQNAKANADPTPENWQSLHDLIAVPGETLIPQRTAAAVVPLGSSTASTAGAPTS